MIISHDLGLDQWLVSKKDGLLKVRFVLVLRAERRGIIFISHPIVLGMPIVGDDTVKTR